MGSAVRDNVQRAFETARDSITVKRVFGEAHKQNGTTVIPAAQVAGGGGGSALGDNADGEQSGGSAGGFGVRARPVGAYVIDGERVRWRPAVDVNRIVLSLILLGAFALLIWKSVEKTRHDAVPSK